MRNRSVLTIVPVVLGLLSLMSSADAQLSGKVPRIGYLSGAAPVVGGSPTLQAFRQGLRELGFVEGEHLRVRHQHEDREGPRPHDPAVGARAGG
jgi:putative tryptophan/tyrosine transport system substrate-binding protein